MKISLMLSNSFLAETCDGEIGLKSTTHSLKFPSAVGDVTDPFQMPGSCSRIPYPSTTDELLIVGSAHPAPIGSSQTSSSSSFLLHDEMISNVKIRIAEGRNRCEAMAVVLVKVKESIYLRHFNWVLPLVRLSN